MCHRQTLKARCHSYIKVHTFDILKNGFLWPSSSTLTLFYNYVSQKFVVSEQILSRALIIFLLSLTLNNNFKFDFLWIQLILCYPPPNPHFDILYNFCLWYEEFTSIHNNTSVFLHFFFFFFFFRFVTCLLVKVFPFFLYGLFSFDYSSFFFFYYFF